MPIITIYRRASGKGKNKRPDEGDPLNIQVGDGITFYNPRDRQYAAGKVERINHKAGVLRLEAMKFGKIVLRPPRRLGFDEIIKAERKITHKKHQEIKEDLVVPESSSDTKTEKPVLTTTPPEPSNRDPRLPPPGTHIKRSFKGKVYEILVKEETFVWEGREYPSLSKLAKDITGTSTNGFAFFRLKI